MSTFGTGLVEGGNLLPTPIFRPSSSRGQADHDRPQGRRRLDRRRSHHRHPPEHPEGRRGRRGLLFGFTKAKAGVGGFTAGDQLMTETATGKLVTKTSTNTIVAVAIETVSADEIGLVRVIRPPANSQTTVRHGRSLALGAQAFLSGPRAARPSSLPSHFTSGSSRRRAFSQRRKLQMPAGLIRKAQPTLSQVHVAAPLTNIAVAYMQDDNTTSPTRSSRSCRSSSSRTSTTSGRRTTSSATKRSSAPTGKNRQAPA
jgi:hypothetical protein